MKVVGTAFFKSGKLDQLVRQKSDETGFTAGCMAEKMALHRTIFELPEKRPICGSEHLECG